MDGVLSFTAEAVTGALNAMFSTDYSPVSQTFFPGTLVGSRLPAEQAAWISGLLRDPSFLATFAPDFHAFTTLNDAWEAGCPVRVVTEREPACQAATTEWLATWGAPPVDVDAVGRGNKPGFLTAQYGPEHPCVLIDDNPSLAVTFAGDGREVWAPRRPYTPNVPRPHVGVFDSWQQARAWLGISPQI